MRTPILFLLLIILAIGVNAQSLITMDFNPEDDNTLISENDSLKCYVSQSDTNRTVCINEDASYYKLMTRSRRLITDGYFIAEGDKYLQDGKWTQRYDNGKVRITGYYSKGRPVGLWQEFYSNGKPKVVSNYAIISDNVSLFTCLSGTYQEYYIDGKLKVNGFYSANQGKVNDTTIIEDPISDSKVKKVITRNEYVPVKTGHWEYYSETGELDKKEDL